MVVAGSQEVEEVWERWWYFSCSVEEMLLTRIII
jgi:hypothetical protein